ncbi:MAG: cyclic nucleotide-binding domain-containing protein [Rhodospirillaceae bacterium]|nr:cyclic nucleotide-binding domain-containing protein [Rhodospirillaceae bacterium]
MAMTLLDEMSIEVANFPKGKVLFRQGERGGAAYIVNSGAIGIYREAGDRKIPLATVRKGELFGEMAVIDNSPRMATAFTLEESTLTVISIDTLMDKMRKSDPFIRALVQMLMNNLRSVHDSYTPKSRSLLDSVNSLQKQSEMVVRFLQTSIAPELRQELETKVQEFERVIKDLRRIAMTHRAQDRREDAIPSESDLPA